MTSKSPLPHQPPSPGRDSLAKSDIVKAIQESLKNTRIPSRHILQVLDAFLSIYKQSLLDQERIEIRNFGVLSRELIKGRIITHPETGEEQIASPYYRIRFKPSAAFRKKLREKAKQEVTKL